MDARQPFEDLPDIRVGEDGEGSHLPGPYPFASSRSDPQAAWRAVTDPYSTRTLDAFPRPLDHTGLDNMQRFLQTPESTTVLPERHFWSQRFHNLDTPIDKYFKDPRGLYPRMPCGRGISPPGSGLDDLSLIDPVSSTGSVFSPPSSHTELSFQFSGGPLDHHDELDAFSTVESPRLVSPDCHSTYSAYTDQYQAATGPYVDPRSLQAYFETSGIGYDDEGASCGGKTEHSQEKQWPLEGCSTTPLSFVDDGGLGASIDDGSANLSTHSGVEETDSSRPSGERSLPVNDLPPGGRTNRRGTTRKSTLASIASANRVTKRGKQSALACGEHPNVHFKNKSEYKKHIQTKHTRPFSCVFAPYGCQSTFGSKNEWKRHVNSQHLCLSFWRCNQGACTKDPSRPNDFNRKDLFTQHLKRMHRPKPPRYSQSEMEAWTKRTLPSLPAQCYMSRREAPPRSRCGLCDELFEGAGSWDERMEHVGKHLEKQGHGVLPVIEQNMNEWEEDMDLKRWLINEDLLQWRPQSGAWIVVGGAGTADGASEPRRTSSRGKRANARRAQKEDDSDAKSDVAAADGDEDVDAEGESDPGFDVAQWNT